MSTQKDTKTVSFEIDEFDYNFYYGNVHPESHLHEELERTKNALLKIIDISKNGRGLLLKCDYESLDRYGGSTIRSFVKEYDTVSEEFIVKQIIQKGDGFLKSLLQENFIRTYGIDAYQSNTKRITFKLMEFTLDNGSWSMKPTL